MKNFLTLLGLLIYSFSIAQTDAMKKMSPDVYSEWNTIQGIKLDDKGQVITYLLEAEQKNAVGCVYRAANRTTEQFQRTKSIAANKTGEFVAVLIEPSVDSVRNHKRRKTKEKDMPKDSLLIYRVNTAGRVLIPHVKAYGFSASGQYLVYKPEIDRDQDDRAKADSTYVKENDKNGSKLIVRNLATSREDTLYYVIKYEMSDFEDVLIYQSGEASKNGSGIYKLQIDGQKTTAICSGHCGMKAVAFARDAASLAVMIDRDSTEDKSTPHDVQYAESGGPFKPLNTDAIYVDEKTWNFNDGSNFYFSRDGRRLFFGIAPHPVEQDTSLLKDEIVNVEVWTYLDQKLYTQQENDYKRDLNKDWLHVLDLENEQIWRLETLEIEEVNPSLYAGARYAIGTHSRDYYKYLSWEGYVYRDIYVIDLETGDASLIAHKQSGFPILSPDGRYVFWFNAEEGGYKVYSTESRILSLLVDDDMVPLLDEQNDVPQHPSSYGFAGWTTGDEFFLVYDRYDIWQIDPTQKRKPKRLTKGREEVLVHRYVSLDPDERHIDRSKKMLLRLHRESDKSEGYGYLMPGGETKVLYCLPYAFDSRPIKAKEANVILTTRESFVEFPNYFLTDSSFALTTPITDANPQQASYAWGSIELVEWRNKKGEKLNGLLVKPPGFDPYKKYPMIVNFYERSSDGLHRHRAPYAHRSTINYSYYANKGYLIFNPDVTYDIGYPGQSCVDDVLSGVEAMIRKEFVDPERIGIQGHSWGGYQIAHLLTKTNIFRCAESGAPVVNMISAYGGIRWGSGMSRMFQYERTQSRLGATLWERPDLYIENSPIFEIDKVETPVLILHNDEDGAVPWYQGIEYFVALRRLNKPAWLLNYNGEPHWPLAWQNRLDFNIRMEQFFDHFLLGEPMPKWMKEGVPAIHKGILQGLEKE